MKKLLLAIALCLLAGSAMAADVSLAWTHSVSDDVAGYKVYYGMESRSYGEPIVIGYQDTYTVQGLADETEYFFAVTAFDNAGNESGYSNEVSTIIPDTTPPEPPVLNDIPPQANLNYSDEDVHVSLKITKIKR